MAIIPASTSAPTVARMANDNHSIAFAAAIAFLGAFSSISFNASLTPLTIFFIIGIAEFAIPINGLSIAKYTIILAIPLAANANPSPFFFSSSPSISEIALAKSCMNIMNTCPEAAPTFLNSFAASTAPNAPLAAPNKPPSSLALFMSLPPPPKSFLISCNVLSCRSAFLPIDSLYLSVPPPPAAALTGAAPGLVNAFSMLAKRFSIIWLTDNIPANDLYPSAGLAIKYLLFYYLFIYSSRIKKVP